MPAELLIVDSLRLNGYDSNGYESVSPYAIAAGEIDLSPASRRYEWTETGYSAGSALAGEAKMGNVERTWPLQVRARFSSALTNVLTNPRPGSSIGSWENFGTVSSVAIADLDGEDVVSVTTNGNANTGLDHPFTGTVAAYSGGVWVKTASSTAPIDVQFDSDTPTSITATTDWQFVKTENVTLTAAARKFKIIQTDTGSRTFYVKWAGVHLGSTYKGYFDGACGDARWTGTAHASTSTSLTGQDAIDVAFDTLAEKSEKAIYSADVESSATGGTGLVGYWTPNGATKGRTTLTVKAIDVADLKYDYTHHHKNIAMTEVRLTCHPYALGAEYTAGSASKAAGAPALEMTISSAKGATKGPARIVLTAGALQDQRFAAFGVQGRDYVSGTDLILRAASLGTSGYSGSLTSATNEVQTLSRTGIPASGTFTLTLDGKTTSAIAYDATAATIEAAIEALTNVGTDNVACTGGPIHTTDVVVTFQNDLGGGNVSLMTVTDSVGGGDITCSTTTAGVPGYVSAALYDDWTTICDTGNLTHVGSYSVWARVYDNAATSDLYDASIRLVWGLGDMAATTTNDSTVPQAAGDYSLINLGQVHIPTVATGTQRWKGRIEGKTSGTAGNSIRIVDLMFVPVETGFAYVKVAEPSGGRLTGFDDFDQSAGDLTGGFTTNGVSGATNASPIVITSTSHGLSNGNTVWIEKVGGNTAANGYWTVANVAANTFELSGSTGNGAYTSGGTISKIGKTADLGGGWYGTGDTTDFSMDTTNSRVQRTATSDSSGINNGRIAILATTSYTETQVAVDSVSSALSSASDVLLRGVVVRYADVDNFVVCYLHWQATSYMSMTVAKRASGTTTTLGTTVVGGRTETQSHNVKFVVRAAGAWEAFYDGISVLSGTDTALATGGALASGRSGLFDQYTAGSPAITRFYDNLRVHAIAAAQPAAYASQDLQFRANGDVLREDSAGAGIYTLLGNATVSHLPELTPAGSAGITNRLLIMTSRNNPDLASDPLPDAFDVTVYHRPVYALARSST